MSALKKNWKALVLVGAVLAGLGGYGVWYNLFRVDPEFTEQVEQQDQKQQAVDEALGLDDDDDFADLEKEAKATDSK